MPTDREHSNEVDRDSNLPIADIDGRRVEAADAEKVKGGAASSGKVTTHDIPITKHTDSSSPS